MKKEAIDLPALLDAFLSPGTKALVVIIKDTDEAEDGEKKNKEKSTNDLTDVAREIFDQHNNDNNLFVTGGGSGGAGAPLTVQEG